jgi:hypothetical protein
MVFSRSCGSFFVYVWNQYGSFGSYVVRYSRRIHLQCGGSLVCRSLTEAKELFLVHRAVVDCI